MSQVPLFVMHVLLGRSLGVADYGAFSIAVGAATMLAQVATHGWPAAVVRLIPEATATRDLGVVRNVIKSGTRLVIATSIAVALVTAMIGNTIFGSSWVVLAATALLILIALRNLMRGLLVGLGRPVVAAIIADGFGPTLLILGLLFFGLGRELDQSITAMTGSVALAALAAMALVFRQLPHVGQGRTRTWPRADWTRLALTIFSGGIGVIVLQRAEVLVMAPLHGEAEAGLFTAALRLGFVVALLPTLVSSITSAQISLAFHDNRKLDARRLLFTTTLFCAVLAGSMGLFLAVFASDLILVSYGTAFSEGSTYLPLVVLAHSVFGATSPVMTFLVVAGAQRFFAIVTVSVGFGFVGACWLIGSSQPPNATVTLYACAHLVLAAIYIIRAVFLLRRH